MTYRDSAKIQLYECMLKLYTADCYLCDGHAGMYRLIVSCPVLYKWQAAILLCVLYTAVIYK